MKLYALQCCNGLFYNAILTKQGWLELKKTSYLQETILYTEKEYEQVKHVFPNHEPRLVEITSVNKQRGKSLYRFILF